MSNIQYTSLSVLQPIKLNYTYSTTEPLLKQHTTYNTGLNTYILKGTNLFQDVSFNNETCLVLTSSINLSSVFATQLFENSFFGTILLKPRSSQVYYVAYNNILNSLYLSPSGSQIYVAPISATNEVELFVNRQYIQVEENYPYNVYLTEKPLDLESIHRQRFICTVQNNTISFKTRTKDGYRYIGFGTDGELRATGVILNNTVLNDYIFNVEFVAVNTGVHGFIPINNFVTYYFDIEGASDNKNLLINKHIDDNPTNFLVSFTFENINDNTATVNIANLKNVVTPAGGAATIDNSYTKTAIATTN